MADTQTTLLRRVRDPADADAWRQFVALYRPLLRAYYHSAKSVPIDIGAVR